MKRQWWSDGRYTRCFDEIVTSLPCGPALGEEVWRSHEPRSVVDPRWTDVEAELDRLTVDHRVEVYRRVVAEGPRLAPPTRWLEIAAEVSERAVID